MPLTDDLTLGFGNRRLPMLLQAEATECGLACLAMIACFHGYRTDVASLRHDFPVSLNGMTFADLIRVAESLHLSPRPLRLELENLRRLQMPCILHWTFDHYVVLKTISRGTAVIHDPAVGERRLALGDLSAAFTGVALELWPNPEFTKKSPPRPLALKKLLGRVTGLWRTLSQVMLLAASLEVFSIVGPFFLQWVVDHVVTTDDRDLLTTLAIGFGLIAIMKVVVSAVRSWVIMHMSTILSLQWRTNVLRHLLHLPVDYFMKRHIGDINARFGAIDQIQNTITTSFVEALLDGLMSLITIIVMMIYSVRLGLIASLAALLYGLVRWVWYGALRAATNSQIVLGAKQQSHFLESIRGIRTIKLMQRESQRTTSWSHMVLDQLNAGLRTQKLQIIYSGVNNLLTSIETILIVWFGARMILDGNFTVGALMAFKSYDDQFLQRSSALVDKLMQFQMVRLYGERLADIVLTDPEKQHAGGLLTHQTPRCAIEVTDVRYRYAEHEPLILNGITFLVSDGESVAITGPSGCGKSTLLNIILGVLVPTSGTVRFGGLTIPQLGTDKIRNAIGCVIQDDVLFAGSIRDNICFFADAVDTRWIEECATVAGIHNEIMALPMGYNSLVGDMGSVLSGGQRQRILLARALYKKPTILLLDEATSQLDVARERAIAAALKPLNLTRIVIAHRPETIATADRVIALQDGKICNDYRVAQPQVRPSAHRSQSHVSLTLDSAPPFLRTGAVE